MRPSAIRESALVIAAATVSIAVAASWPHDRPSHCPPPSPASVEMLFAPCLAADRTTPPDDLNLEPAPSLAIPPTAPPAHEPAVAGRGSQGDDVEATGSLRVK